MKTRILSKRTFWIYFLAIILLVTLPINPKGEKINNITILHLRWDYITHAVILLPWMLFQPVIRIKLWLWFLYGLLFAAGVEIIQYVIPYRSFNINDMAGNAAGVVMGLVIILTAQRRKGIKA